MDDIQKMLKNRRGRILPSLAFLFRTQSCTAGGRSGSILAHACKSLGKVRILMMRAV